jgi:hypothetical protein
MSVKGDQTMSDTVMCDWVWQDERDGYNYFTCNEHGCMESEKIEVDLDDE